MDFEGPFYVLLGLVAALVIGLLVERRRRLDARDQLDDLVSTLERDLREARERKP